MIAALYVERGGPYFGRPGVDPWDKERDAQKYDGPHTIVAHPPCGPWGGLRKFYRGNEFALAPLAICQVRKWGGVLEHPARSLLWHFFDLPQPGSLYADRFGGYSIEVQQVDWGHPARKRTWLYIVGAPRETLVFPPPREPTHWVSGGRNRPDGGGGVAPPGIKICSAQQRRRTPSAFADWLVGIAETAQHRRLAA